MRKVPSWIRARKIAVLYGGRSAERSISLVTGKAVLKGLKDAGLKAVGIDAGKDLPEKLRRSRANYCFIALHGRFGEDGTVQGLCEIMGIPYTGSGVLASAVSMNKAATKAVFAARGIPTARYETLTSEQTPQLAPPYVVKPVDAGSAIGVTIVRDPKEAPAAVRLALRHSKEAIVEAFIAGREVTAPVLGEQVLPLIEIVPKRAFYDFKAKYEPGMSDHVLPARLPDLAAQSVRKWALEAHRALGCRAFSRTDFIVDAEDRPWALEINSIPGMTATSLFPEAAAHAGWSFPEVLVEIIRLSGPRA